MSVGCLNLLKILHDNIPRGVGVAIGTEIGAGVVHADVLALDATALLSLALVLERPVAHDRNDLVELGEKARRRRSRLLLCEERHEGIVFGKESGKKLSVNTAVSLDSEAAQVDSLRAGCDREVPSLLMPVGLDLVEPLGDFLDLRLGRFGKRDVLGGIERRHFRDEVSLHLPVDSHVGKGDDELFGRPSQSLAQIPNLVEDIPSRLAFVKNDRIETPDYAGRSDFLRQRKKGFDSAIECGNLGFESFRLVVIQRVLKIEMKPSILNFIQITN